MPVSVLLSGHVGRRPVETAANHSASAGAYLHRAVFEEMLSVCVPVCLNILLRLYFPVISGGSLSLYSITCYSFLLRSCSI